MALAALYLREIGAGCGAERLITQERTRSLGAKSASAQHGAGLACLALDKTQRLALVGRLNGELGLRDLEREKNGEVATCSRAQAKEYGHRGAVSAVEWLGADNGLFVSGGKDKFVLAWDTEAFVPVCKFPLRAMVHTVSMTKMPGAATGRLVVCGTDEPYVRICDLGSGSHSQILKGHRSAVLCSAWSPASEYVLATGSADKTIRLWDLRRAGDKGCFAVLDQANAQRLAQRGEKRKSMLDKQNISHDGAVLKVQFLAGGHYLMSSGADSRLKLWEGTVRDPQFGKEYSYKNTFVNYSAAEIGTALSPFGAFAVSDDSCDTDSLTVFHAVGQDGTSLAAFDVNRGDLLPCSRSMVKSGHFMRITAMVFRETDQDLYTAGLDGMLLRWTSPYPNKTFSSTQSDTDSEPNRRIEEQEEEYDVDWVSDVEQEEDIEHLL